MVLIYTDGDFMVTKDFIKDNEGFLKGLYRSKGSQLTTEDIQDLVQDTFEKVTLYQDYFIHDFDKSHKIPEGKRVQAWLKLVAVQVYDRHLRGLVQITEIAKDYTEDDLLFSNNEYYYHQHKEEIDALIELLPNKQKETVYLKLILGHTYEEIANKVHSTVTAVSTLFSRGLANLKKLINSDNPEDEVMYEPKILKPHGDKPYAGDWAWRYGESEFQRNTRHYIYTNEEIIAYCNLNNLKYNLKERII